VAACANLDSHASRSHVEISLPRNRASLLLRIASLRGDGNIAATGIDSRNVTVSLPGSGNIDATGTTTKLT
jgi:hypothetical protein